MAHIIICDFQQFLDVINPLIEKYGIEKNEQLTSAICECYERLKSIDRQEKTGVENLINQFMKEITNWKMDEDSKRLIHDISLKIVMTVNEMEKEINHLQKANITMEESINELKESNEALKTRMDLVECFNYSFDLAQLFISYYVEPHLKAMDAYKVKYKNWALFKEEVSILRRRVNTPVVVYGAP